MIVWDRGRYHTVDGLSPSESLAKGKLDLSLDGFKLRGRFALVRTQEQGGKHWLLLRKGQAPQDGTDLIADQPASVYSGLSVEELHSEVSYAEALEDRADAVGAPRRALDAARLRPMLAGTGDGPFSRAGWIFELKYDGMRVLAERSQSGGVRLFTRRGRDVTSGYPEISRALAHLAIRDALIDGEIVVLDEVGRSSFERLQKRFNRTDPAEVARAGVDAPAAFYAFDLLSVSGRDLRRIPLLERKHLLATFTPRLGPVLYADHVETEGQALFEMARDHDLEGVMAKKAGAFYETARRSKSWLKLKVPRSVSVAIVGWVPGRGSRRRLGSLMLAWRNPDEEWVYAGNVGSGLDEATIDQLLPQLEADGVDVPPFARAPNPPPRGGRFARPRLVARVGYTEVTSAGVLRHPVLESLEEEVPLAACRAPIDRESAVEAAPDMETREPDLQITRREKVFWPGEGITKGDLLDFYDAIWPWIAPYLEDRPLVLTRYPDGIDGKSFFQQNAPEWTPGWARHERIDATDFFICNDRRTLLYVVNSGAIPLHVWGSRLDQIDHPDWIVLDLDPKEAPFTRVVEIARHIHRLLEALSTPHYVKTSGQSGIHIMVPLHGQVDHDAARSLAEVLARVVVTELPEIATITRPIAARGDRVYLDFGQNGRGRLIAAPFSVRPRPGAPVSTPLSWGQVTSRLDPAKWNIRNVVSRMEKVGDPLRGVLETRVDLEALLDALVARLE
jgi:bifunctional non-homologous end joining protein LigD